MEPQPPFTSVLSTGMDFGMWCWAFEGVWEPGVEGGVKAGEMRSGRSVVWETEVVSEALSRREAYCGWEMWRELRSNSEIWRETGIGRGE